MPVTNFPGGVASMGVPLLGGEDALPAAPIWWVCNRTGVINGDGRSADRPLPGLADAMIRLTASNPFKGEEIRILPGHAENVTGLNIFSGSSVNTAAVTWVQGLRIKGYGDGALRPTFTFTAEGSKLTLDAASVSFENIIFTADPAAATTVTAGFNVNAKYCGFRRCRFVPAISTKGIFTTVVLVGAGANDADGFIFENNRLFAPTLATNPTDILKIGQVEDDVSIIGNVFQCATNAANNGVINVAAAATGLDIGWNTILNRVAASAACIKGTAAMTGLIRYNTLGVIAGSTANNTTVIDTPGNACLVENYGAKIGLASAICGGTPA